MYVRHHQASAAMSRFFWKGRLSWTVIKEAVINDGMNRGEINRAKCPIAAEYGLIKRLIVCMDIFHSAAR